jgi:predicted phosphodiesterase
MQGLTQGGIFTYRVLKNNIIVFTAEGHAPKSSKQAYQFVVFGDIGAETKDQKQLALRAYLEKPDFVVVPGDIVYEAGLISEYRKKFWPVYNADTANANGAPIMRSVPFLAAVGNHDADSRDLDKTPDALAYYMYWVQPLNGPLGAEGGAIVPILKGSEINKNAFINAAGKAYPRMTNFSYNYGNAHWTFLDADTYVDWTNKELVDWVVNDLATSKEASWHFVVFHHPGFNSSIEHFEQQQMRLLAPVFEKGKVDVVFNGHVHNYQRSFPMTFAPVKQGVLLMGGKDGKTIRGRVVTGKWTLDKQFDGKKITKPNGVIYIVTGAGGQELYNPEQEKDADSWQHFTSKFISTKHSLTVAKVSGNKLVLQQKSQDGKILDALTITK